jgi:transposase
MRGEFLDQGAMFSYVLPEQRIPADHPLRPIRALVREVFGGLDGSFRKLYSADGRPSIPPEQLLSALLICGIRCNADTDSSARRTAIR